MPRNVQFVKHYEAFHFIHFSDFQTTNECLFKN